MSLFAVGLIVNIIRNHSFGELKKPLMDIDYTTLLLLAGLFVVIGGITEAGVIDAIADLFLHIGGSNMVSLMESAMSPMARRVLPTIFLLDFFFEGCIIMATPQPTAVPASMPITSDLPFILFTFF